jgi:hypothetical protein
MEIFDALLANSRHFLVFSRRIGSDTTRARSAMCGGPLQQLKRAIRIAEAWLATKSIGTGASGRRASHRVTPKFTPVATTAIVESKKSLCHRHKALYHARKIAMSHMAITEVTGGKYVAWMEKVTDEQYKAVPG